MKLFIIFSKNRLRNPQILNVINLIPVVGSARAVRTNGHTEFTMLVNKPKSKAVRIALRSVFLAITIVFLVLLLIWTAQYTAAGTMLSTTLRIPRMYYYVSIPIGFALMIYEYLRTIKSRTVDDPATEQE